MGVSENVVYPIVPNGFADHYPYEKWLLFGNINPIFRQTHMICNAFGVRKEWFGLQNRPNSLSS